MAKRKRDTRDMVDDYVLAKLVEGIDSFDKIGALIGKNATQVSKSRDRLKSKGKIHSFDKGTKSGYFSFPEKTLTWYKGVNLEELAKKCGSPKIQPSNIQTELDFESETTEDTNQSIQTEETSYLRIWEIRVDDSGIIYSDSSNKPIGYIDPTYITKE